MQRISIREKLKHLINDDFVRKIKSKSVSEKFWKKFSFIKILKYSMMYILYLI